MAVVACLLLLLLCSIAGQATPTKFFATGVQAVQVGEKGTGTTWLHDDRSKTPSAMRGIEELGEVLSKRTSGTPWHRPWLAPLQDTGVQQVPPSHMGAPPAQYVQGGNWRGLSTVTPLQNPAVGPSAPHTEAGSSSKQPNKASKRHWGSLSKHPALQARAKRDIQARMMQRIRDGERINSRKRDGSEYDLKTFEEYQASQKAGWARRWRDLNDEDRAKINQRKNENARRLRAKRKAQREAEREGRIWQGSPIRRGRPRQYRDEEEEQAQAEADKVHSHESVNGASHQPFAPGTSSSSLDLDLSLSAPGSSTPGQRQTTRAPQRAAPPFAASTRDEKRLRRTLAPPGQHDPPGKNDKLRLTIAPPRHD